MAEDEGVTPGLIAVDLDSTLLRAGQVHPEDLRSLFAARAAGVPVVVATGRSQFSAQPVLDELGLGDLYVCYNGAFIVDAAGGRPRDLRVPLDVAREVLRECRRIRVAVRVFLPREVVMSEEPGPDEAFFQYRPFERVDLGIVDTLDQPPIQMVLVHLDDIRAFKRRFKGTHVELDLQWMLEGRDPETPHLWALHLLNRQSLKSLALAQLCDRWGIEPANVLAFGDGPNDINLLEWAGTSVSFPWAVRAAQAAAGIISSANDPHPIATVVYPWLKEQLGVDVQAQINPTA
jgi:5-amino-6-(5-phospho-D-ribitylamino)uracil phosphatase